MGQLIIEVLYDTKLNLISFIPKTKCCSNCTGSLAFLLWFFLNQKHICPHHLNWLQYNQQYQQPHLPHIPVLSLQLLLEHNKPPLPPNLLFMVIHHHLLQHIVFHCLLPQLLLLYYILHPRLLFQHLLILYLLHCHLLV